MASASLALIVGKYVGHEPSFFYASLGARPSRTVFLLCSSLVLTFCYSLAQDKTLDIKV